MFSVSTESNDQQNGRCGCGDGCAGGHDAGPPDPEPFSAQGEQGAPGPDTAPTVRESQPAGAGASAPLSIVA